MMKQLTTTKKTNSSMFALPFSPSKYHPSKFVERTQELGTIEKKVSEAYSGTPAESVINFWGIKGIGKTWLLNHLHYTYQYKKDFKSVFDYPTFTLFYSFPPDSKKFVFKTMTTQLAGEAISQLPSDFIKDQQRNLNLAQKSGSVQALVVALSEISKQITPLILFDNTESVASNKWEKVEKEIIEPLVQTNRVIIVVAGRREIPRWRRFEVRRRLMDTSHSMVQPFNSELAAKQIQKADYPFPIDTDVVFPYTAGSPYLVDRLARSISLWSSQETDEAFDREWLARHHKDDLLQILQNTENEMLERVPQKLRAVLSILSPLRFYRLEALKFMLIQENANSKQKSDGYYLGILRDLEQKTEVVWWDRKQRAYVTSTVIRKLVNKKLLLEGEGAEYIKQHTHALKMYWSWAKKYPEASEDFVLEILFHLASLWNESVDNQELVEEAKRSLEFAYKHLSIERLLILHKQMEGDKELLDLLPKSLHIELVERNGTVLNQS